MNFLRKSYQDYNIFVFLFFLWALFYSFSHLIDSAWILFHLPDTKSAESTSKLFMHFLTIGGSILILKERAEGILLWGLTPFIAYGAAFLLFEYKEAISVEFLIKKALYLLIPACLLFLKQNGKSGWKVLFGKRQQGENDSLQAK